MTEWNAALKARSTQMVTRFSPQFVDAILHVWVVLDPEPQARGGDMAMFEWWVHDLEDPHSLRQRVAFIEIQAGLFRFALAALAKSEEGPISSSPQTVAPVGGLNQAEKIALYIAQHCAEPLTSEQISRSVGSHPNDAMSLFRNAMGVSIVDCLTQRRVSHAQRLLATTDEKIIEVAFAAVFGSLSRFHHALKRWRGCTPNEYRRKHRVGIG